MKFQRKIELVVLLLVALGARPLSAAFWQWSTTASTNASVDPSINWAEGMSPSSVNDSARAMMARLAEYRLDTVGALVATGTSTAYSLTSNEGGFSSSAELSDKLFSFLPHTTNGNNPTLTMDGIGPFPITIGGNPVPAGTLLVGSPYDIVYKEIVHEWRLKSAYGAPTAVPLGAMIPYTGPSAPNAAFVIPVGQCISRTTYATYFALVGTTFGGCDGSTTFAVPNMSGRIPAAMDASGTVLSSATMSPNGNTMGATGGAQQITISTAQLPAITPAGSVAVSTPTGTVVAAGTVSSFTPSGTVSSFTPSGSVSVTAAGTISAVSPSGWSVSVTSSDNALVNAASSFITGVTPASGTGSATVTSGTSASARNSTGGPGSITGSSVTPTFTNNGSSGSFTGNSVTPTFTGNSVTPTFTNSGSTFTGNAQSATFTGTSFGSGTATTVMQPTMLMNYILRVL